MYIDIYVESFIYPVRKNGHNNSVIYIGIGFSLPYGILETCKITEKNLSSELVGSGAIALHVE